MLERSRVRPDPAPSHPSVPLYPELATFVDRGWAVAAPPLRKSLHSSGSHQKPHSMPIACGGYGVAECGEINHPLATHVSNVSNPRVDRSANFQPGRPGWAVTDRPQQCQSGLNRTAVILGAANARYKQGHHLIPNEFVDDGVAPDQGLGCGSIKTVQHGCVFAWRKSLANSGGTAHIGEEHSDVQLNAARWEFLAAGSAQIGIFFARVGIPGAQPACRPRHRRGYDKPCSGADSEGGEICDA